MDKRKGFTLIELLVVIALFDTAHPQGCGSKRMKNLYQFDLISLPVSVEPYS
ncbi:MAG: prepilin-type N-terminal cleavage/methylation domain-containing protein [Planctomycetota bacterium]|jgi:hypothetical protein